MTTIQQMFELGMKREIPALLPEPDLTDSLKLNLCAGNSVIAGTEVVDYPSWDADKDQLPFEDNSVDFIHAYHCFEHFKEPVAVLQECQRVLKRGGVIQIVVPYYSSQLQAQDLDHKHAFSEETWKTLLRNKYYNKNQIEWKLHVHANFIMGIVERNVALFTQIQKEW